MPSTKCVALHMHAKRFVAIIPAKSIFLGHTRKKRLFLYEEQCEAKPKKDKEGVCMKAKSKEIIASERAIHFTLESASMGPYWLV